MKFALDSGSELGQRVARVLLGDHRCESLVMLNADWMPRDSRVTHTKDVTDVDVVISDGTTPLTSLVGRASVAGIPLVVWPDSAASELGSAAVPVVVGANVGSTLADCLLTHPASRPTAQESVTVAWTEPGKPHRDGTPIAFPDPIGMAWAEERSSSRFIAYRDDEWAGTTTIVEGPDGKRVVGVADVGAHLEALTLVAVGLVAADGSFESGIQTSAAAHTAILAELRNLELDIAIWRSTS